MDEKLLPIKLIMPKQGSERRVSGGGARQKPFSTIDSAYRKRLSNQVRAIRKSLSEQIKNLGAAPARLSLIPQAIAKTHRPEKLFSGNTCPIIGAGGLGELFVKATPDGLGRLDDMIEEGNSKQLVKELSSVQSIEPITPNFRLRNTPASELLTNSPRGESGFIVRVRLFDFGQDDDQEKMVADFQQTCRKHRIAITRDGYSLNSFIYAAECRNTSDVESIANVVGVRSIHYMPLIQTVRPDISNTEKLPLLIERTEYSEDVPAVVVVDSGISDELPALKSWILDRESSVAPPYRNTDHGTSVASLICWGHALNPDLKGLNSDPCGVFDLQIVPNSDPAKGDVEPLLESEFLWSLEKSLKQWANKCKVWNLSLNTNAVCLIDEFSSLAEELDNLQEKYQVSFVISAGNYTSRPLLDYPRTREQEENGRITSPADSVLGITVGAISHVDHRNSGVIKDHPSAFSRNGSGPNYVIKPDLVHYGGDCSTDLSYIAGIRSISGRKSVEVFGTSFSAPLVSRTLAQIYHYVTPTPSPVLAKALLTHHSRDPRTDGRVPDGEEKCFGFGRPAPVPYCLECTPYSSTLVFEDTLRPGYFLEWDDFPYPPSLKRDGRYYGEIFMTVAFAPARGSRWGTEYCETHIDASLGVYHEQVSHKTRRLLFYKSKPPNEGTHCSFENHFTGDRQMNTHKLFEQFNRTIKLSDSKRQKLKNSRSALRDKVNKFFEEKGWKKPEFHPQGSFPLQTNLNPISVEETGHIKEKYDMDDGVYFISSESDRKTPETYHSQIKKAVEGHASNIIDKNACVRVVYADGHHIDLPAYWLEDRDSVPQLAHKSEGFIYSDPIEFMDWVEERISETKFTGQLRRIIRYLKAWKDYREDKNSSLKLPAGFILTILACNHYKESCRDDLALCDTVKSIRNELYRNFVCYRPTTPRDEELLGKYDAGKVLLEFEVFAGNAKKAIDSDCEEESSKYWRTEFGNRFPLGNKNKKSFRTDVEKPWTLL